MVGIYPTSLLCAGGLGLYLTTGALANTNTLRQRNRLRPTTTTHHMFTRHMYAFFDFHEGLVSTSVRLLHAPIISPSHFSKCRFGILRSSSMNSATSESSIGSGATTTFIARFWKTSLRMFWIFLSSAETSTDFSAR